MSPFGDIGDTIGSIIDNLESLVEDLDERIRSETDYPELYALLREVLTEQQVRNNSAKQLYEIIGDNEEVAEFIDENNISDEGVLNTLDDIRRFEIDDVSLDELDTTPDRGDPIDRPFIGDHYSENLNARVYINGYRWYITELRMVQDIRTDADYGKVEIYPYDDNIPDNDVPEYDDRIRIDVRLDDLHENNDREYIRSEVYDQWHRLFTGRLNNVRDLADGKWYVEFSNASNEFIYEEVTVDYTDDTINVTEIVKDIATNKISRPLDEDDIIFDNLETTVIEEDDLELTDDDEVIGPADDERNTIPVVDRDDINEIDSGFRVKPNDTEIKYKREQTKVADIFDELGAFTMARWWIDEYNRLHFGKPSSQIREIEFIEDYDTGMLTPPYRSVQVITDPVVAEEGWSQEQLKSYGNAVLTGRITNPGSDEPDIVLNEVDEPIFTYKNLDIKTPEQAKNVTIELLEELAEQLEEGKIMLIGRPDISLYDVIELPEYISSSAEGARQYSVGGITHKINPDDGYITEIEPFHVVGVDSTPQSVTDDLRFRRPDDPDDRETEDSADDEPRDIDDEDRYQDRQRSRQEPIREHRSTVDDDDDDSDLPFIGPISPGIF